MLYFSTTQLSTVSNSNPTYSSAVVRNNIPAGTPTTVQNSNYNTGINIVTIDENTPVYLLREYAEKFPDKLSRMSYLPQLPPDLIQKLIDKNEPIWDSTVLRNSHITEPQMRTIFSRSKNALHARQILKNDSVSADFLEEIWETFESTMMYWGNEILAHPNFPATRIRVLAHTGGDLVKKLIKQVLKDSKTQKKQKLVSWLEDEFPEADTFPEEWLEALLFS